MLEIWKDIHNFSNYQISNMGNIKRKERLIIDSRNHKYLLKEKILKSTKLKNGYLTVTLRKNKKSYLKYIHVLVAESFLGFNKNLIVNHKDGNKDNNHVTNLEWVTYSENNQHAYDNNLKSKNENFYNSKLTIEEIKEIRIIYPKIKNYNVLAKKYNVSRATIRDIILKRTWKNIC